MKPAQCHKRITATYYSACAISRLHHAIVELSACPVGGNLDAYAYTASNEKPTRTERQRAKFGTFTVLTKSFQRDNSDNSNSSMSIDQDEDRREVVRVAVIGIGSAGLGQLKQLKDAFERDDVKREKRLEVVGFETREDVGGIW